MGRISHLVNIDTIEDLLVLLKTYLPSQINAPDLVRLNCIHCALRTLSGPGVELQMDVGGFIDALYEILLGLSADFSRWDLVLDSLDYAFLKRREVRPNVINAFVRHLFFVATQVEPSISVAVLSTAHGLLIRYPNVRNRLEALIPAGFASIVGGEEMKADMAMETLRSEAQTNLYDDGNMCGDGSWSLTLLKQHPDVKFKRIISAMMNRTVIPILTNSSQSTMYHDNRFENFVSSVESVFNYVPSNIGGGNFSRNKKSQHCNSVIKSVDSDKSSNKNNNKKQKKRKIENKKKG